VVLPVEGAPLVYSTSFAHDVVLHLSRPAGNVPRDIPLVPDAFALKETVQYGEKLKGPTGLVVGKDPVTAARLLTEFAKENEDKPGMIDLPRMQRTVDIVSEAFALKQPVKAVDVYATGFVQ